ncbi:MAG: hypothetical protein HUU55_17590 [Myxococcales bacterium]|nr:hypothetical protein [Myxococcales bacterium]
MSTLSIFINKTWDGQPVPEGDHIKMVLDLDNVALHLDVDAPYHGDPPPETPPGSMWELWNYEVVELFIAGAGQRYTEIELGPHGHYLGLRLNGVRNIVQADLPLACRTVIQGPKWHGTVSIPIEHLPPPPWKFNVTAMWGTGINRRYVSLFRLSGSKPDFHRLQDFGPLILPADPYRTTAADSFYVG